MASQELMAMAFEMITPGYDKEKLSGEFLEIDEAICWVAFDQFQFPAFGPREAHVFMIHVDLSAWLDEEADRHEKAFEIARNQIFNAIENGHILLVGKETEQEAGEAKENFVQPFVTFVTPQMLSEGGWKESNRSYEIGELQFDGLFVRFADIQRLFGPFKKASSQSASQPTTSIPTPQDNFQDDPKNRKRGRRPKYDWEGILAAVSHGIGQSGNYPENQAALERLIAQFCLETTGDEPAASLIRQKASGLFEVLRLNRQ